MNWTSALAIYLLFWVMSAFLVMPFFVRTADETGEDMIPGQAESAPSRVKPARILLWTTGVSIAMFGFYYVNYINGWIDAESLDFFRS